MFVPEGIANQSVKPVLRMPASGEEVQSVEPCTVDTREVEWVAAPRQDNGRFHI